MQAKSVANRISGQTWERRRFQICQANSPSGTSRKAPSLPHWPRSTDLIIKRRGGRQNQMRFQLMNTGSPVSAWPAAPVLSPVSVPKPVQFFLLFWYRSLLYLLQEITIKKGCPKAAKINIKLHKILYWWFSLWHPICGFAIKSKESKEIDRFGRRKFASGSTIKMQMR